MSKEQVMQLALIVGKTAIETMAAVNKCAISDVCEAIRADVEIAVNQYNKLFDAGMQTAIQKQMELNAA